MNLKSNYATVLVFTRIQTNGTIYLMDRIFQRIVDDNFSDLKGMTANASIPVPEYLVNEIIAAALQGNKNISSCQLSIHSERKVSAKLRTRLLPLSIDLKLNLDRSVDFESLASPKIRAWLQNNLLLGKLGSLFNVLPKGMKLYGNQLVVDLSTFIQSPEQRRLLDLVKEVEINTEEAKVILEVKIKV